MAKPAAKHARVREKFSEAGKHKNHPAKKKNAKKDEFYQVSLVKLHGVIASDMYKDDEDEGKVINWDKFESVIAKAFAWKESKAVVLDIDSPGGSPAEAEMIGREIRFQAKMHNKPVYAFVRGSANSGGYWIACAADKIYALDTSNVGSVGVITQGFGFHERDRKKGVERRIFTAGDRKSQMDEHLPLRKEDVKKTREDLRDLHRTFKDWVIERRGDAFKGKPKDILNGDSWYAEKALKLGLIDGIGFMKDIMAEMTGKKVAFGIFEPEEKTSLLEEFMEAMTAGAETVKKPGARAHHQPRILALDDRPRPKF